jgi:muramoyltetrapeptide carboxypeptidase
MATSLPLPPLLEPGDTLGVVAPASHFRKQRFADGIAVLERLGFVVRYDEGLFARERYLAGTDRHRADQINRCFADPGIDGIVAARGGFGCMRLLPHLDVAAIRANPKVFVGYSDITALLALLSDRCGMTVFHGPTVSGLGTVCSRSVDDLFRRLTGNGGRVVSPLHPDVIRPGRATGRLAGGNLTVLCHLTGTPFFPSLDECILLLEDRGEAPYRIDRMLCQMTQAGCFAGLRGIVLGEFTDCGDKKVVAALFKEIFEPLGIPILGGFAVGHGRTNLTLPLGRVVHMDTDAGALQVGGRDE